MRCLRKNGGGQTPLARFQLVSRRGRERLEEAKQCFQEALSIHEELGQKVERAGLCRILHSSRLRTVRADKAPLCCFHTPQKGGLRAFTVLIAVHLPLRSFELWVARRTGEVSAVQASALEVRVLEERPP